VRVGPLVNAELREQAIPAITHHPAGRQRPTAGSNAPHLIGPPCLLAPSRVHALSRLSP
jgi:hypothetical protein